MQLSEFFYALTVEELTRYMSLMGGGKGVSRKAERVDFLLRVLQSRQEIRRLWGELDDLSRKAVAAAFHNDGHFVADAFVAQYGSLPARPKSSRSYWRQELIVLDLFIFKDTIPPEIMVNLGELVPDPERFQLTGVQEIPPELVLYEDPVPQIVSLRQEAGRQDLLLFLTLLDQGMLKLSTSSKKLTPKSVRDLLGQLQDGDWATGMFAVDKVTDSICIYGLNTFATQSGLVNPYSGELTDLGRHYLVTEDAAILLEALESWTETSLDDELSRITALKGMRSKGIQLTNPAMRRERVVEALSWTPAGVWISVADFYRAIKIWHFDFDVEEGGLEKLYMGYRYGRDGWYEEWAETDLDAWKLTTGLNINVILWETLASIGALDIIFVEDSGDVFPARIYNADDNVFSPYDGLLHFRITPLGAYLFGQAEEFAPVRPVDAALFSVDGDGVLHVLAENGLAVVHRTQLESMADEFVADREGETRFRLSKAKLLTLLESQPDLEMQRTFLAQRNQGPLPGSVMAFLDQAEADSRAVQAKSRMLTLQVRSAQLAQAILDHPVAGKLARQLDSQTLLIPESRKTAFRNALREMGYGLMG